MTPIAIVKWFGVPELERGDLRERARALWLVSWPFFVVITVVLVAAGLIEPGTLVRRATTIASVGLLVTVLHMTSRAGRPVLASWILVIGLTVIVTQRAWITGGVHSPVALFYAVFIVMAGSLLGILGAAATAAVSILGSTALVTGAALGLIPPRPGFGSATEAFLFVALAIAVSLLVVQMHALRNRRRALHVDVVQSLVEDMRSPMQVLLLRLELLRHALRGDIRRDADVAIDAVGTLRRMTNTLLDVALLDSGRLPVRRAVTNLSTLVNDLVSAAVVRSGRDIALEVRGDPMCACDPHLTGRTVENLLTNAAKVTPPDGRVRVVVAGSGNRASITVMDEGRTVPANERSRVFVPFRAERQLRNIAADEMYGIGLAFCKLAVEAQGGTIRVEDGVPRGNAFIVELSC